MIRETLPTYLKAACLGTYDHHTNTGFCICESTGDQKRVITVELNDPGKAICWSVIADPAIMDRVSNVIALKGTTLFQSQACVVLSFSLLSLIYLFVDDAIVID